jgi:hypothetical protein
MKPIPTVSDSDISRAFIGELSPRQQRKQANRDSRLKLLAEFKACWWTNLGNLLDVPTNKQIFTWFRTAEYDWNVLSANIAALRSRAKHAFDGGDPRGHALRWFTAALVRRTQAKYGRCHSMAVAA